MYLLVNHLTRMKSPRICVAGISAGRHVRPVSKSGDLNFKLLRRSGGALAIGAVVDLGVATPCPKPPEMEDHEFKRWKLKFLRWALASEFWSALNSIAQKDLLATFGPKLHKHGKTCTLDQGCGGASLGCVPLTDRAASISIRERNGKRQVRFQFEDTHFGQLDVGVTDLRLYGLDLETPNAQKVEEISKKLARGVPAIVAVGLTRPFTPEAFGDPVHWLQVNNLHFKDDLIGT
jgi:hypothetical protein